MNQMKIILQAIPGKQILIRMLATNTKGLDINGNGFLIIGKLHQQQPLRNRKLKHQWSNLAITLNKSHTDLTPGMSLNKSTCAVMKIVRVPSNYMTILNLWSKCFCFRESTSSEEETDEENTGYKWEHRPYRPASTTTTTTTTTRAPETNAPEESGYKWEHRPYVPEERTTTPEPERETEGQRKYNRNSEGITMLQ